MSDQILSLLILQSVALTLLFMKCFDGWSALVNNLAPIISDVRIKLKKMLDVSWI